MCRRGILTCDCGFSGLCLGQKTVWSTSGTFRPKRLFRNYKDTQVCYLSVVWNTGSRSWWCHRWRVCLCRRCDLDCVPSHREHHRLSSSGKWQNHQTVEEWLLVKETSPGPEPEPDQHSRSRPLRVSHQTLQAVHTVKRKTGQRFSLKDQFDFNPEPDEPWKRDLFWLLLLVRLFSLKVTWSILQIKTIMLQQVCWSGPGRSLIRAGVGPDHRCGRSLNRTGAGPCHRCGRSLIRAGAGPDQSQWTRIDRLKWNWLILMRLWWNKSCWIYRSSFWIIYTFDIRFLLLSDSELSLVIEKRKMGPRVLSKKKVTYWNFVFSLLFSIVCK